MIKCKLNIIEEIGQTGVLKDYALERMAKLAPELECVEWEQKFSGAPDDFVAEWPPS